MALREVLDTKGVRAVVSTLIIIGVVLLTVWLQNSGSNPTGSAGMSPTPSVTTPGIVDPASPSGPSGTSAAPTGVDPQTGLAWITVADISPEGRRVLAQIDAGGPFAYPDHDGGTFGNREGLLPDRSYGYYREYTVPTPGEGDRGARRIITGSAGEFFWTEDHYDSFERIWR